MQVPRLNKGDKVKPKPEFIARYVGLHGLANETAEVVKISASTVKSNGKPTKEPELLIRLNDVLYIVSPNDVSEE